MKIATSWSISPDSNLSATAAYQSLVDKLGAPPQLIILSASAAYDCNAISSKLRELAPTVQLHGGTSCMGVMTETGFHSDNGFGLGLFGIVDPEGSYGVGAAQIGNDPRRAAALAVQKALEQANRAGELPGIIWMTAAPGHEELLIKGIEDVLGSQVPIMGGSSADNAVAGEWKQFANSEVYANAVVITVMFPTTEVLFAFQSGYEPSSRKGLVTKSEGRKLYEIDGRPAAEVYNEWTEGLISDLLTTGGNILARTTILPVGRSVGAVGGILYYQISHPDCVTPDGAITLFTAIEKGEEIVLMRGTKDSLVHRSQRVALSILESRSSRISEIAGALVVYCAGCMLTIRDRMDEVSSGLYSALSGKPFLGTFTFGEQGCFIGGENRHGNLMISVIVFVA